MKANFRTCTNGHNYEVHYSECPFCPKTTNTSIHSFDDPDKTMVDISLDEENTVFDIKSPKSIGEETQIIQEQSFIGSNSAVNRKLVGWLVTFDLNPLGTDFQLLEGKTHIGRNLKNDIVLAFSEVSDEHCLLLHRNGKLLLDDKLSTNGTFLNENMLEEKKEVFDNDIISVGRTSFKVKLI